MKSTIITLIMLMCGFTVVRAQKVIITEEEINDAIFEVTGINFNSSSSSNSNSNSKGEETDNQIYVVAEKIAEFPGGMNAQIDFINKINLSIHSSRKLRYFFSNNINLIIRFLSF